MMARCTVAVSDPTAEAATSADGCCSRRTRPAYAGLAFLLWLPHSLWAQPLAQPFENELLQRHLGDAAGPVRLSLLVDLTESYQETNPSQAMILGAEAVELLESTPDQELELRLMISLCHASYRRSANERTLHYGRRAAELARATGNRSELAFALTYVSFASRRLGYPEQALAASLEAIRISEELGDKSRLGGALTSAGYVYWWVGDYPKALASYVRAHQTFEAAGDRAGVGWALRNMGTLYCNLGQYPKALEMHELAMEIQREEGNETEIGKILNGIGSSYLGLGEPERALEYLFSSLGIKEKLANKTDIGVSLHAVGRSFRDLGDFDRAMDYFDRALAVRREVGDRRRAAVSLLGIASVHRMKGEYDAAIERLRESLLIASDIKAKKQIQNALRNLSELLAAQGRHGEALDAFRRYEQVKSEASNEESRRTIARMQARFEADQRQRRLELLTHRQALRAHEQDRQRTIQITLIVALALLTLAIVFKTRTARLISHKNDQLRLTMGELAESEFRYRRLFDDGSTAKLVVDPDSGHVLDANKTAQALLGGAGPSSPPAGETPPAPVWLRGILDRLNRLDQDGPASFVEIFRHGGHSDREMEAWVSRLQIQGTQAAMVILNDVTESRRLEEERVRREERELYVAEIEAENAELHSKNAELRRRGMRSRSHGSLTYCLRGPAGQSNRRHPLSSGVNRIGRAEANELVISLVDASRRHAQLDVGPDRLLVEDLGSLNGTWVNGRRIRSCRVRLGDVIRFGSHEFRLERVEAQDIEVGLVLDSPGMPCDRFSEESTSSLSTSALLHLAAEGPGELLFPPDYLPGKSAPMVRLYQAMQPLLNIDMGVLIEGETGVGKECVARILHLSSNRSAHPFVAVNCAAIPGDLLEAEMFGIGKGVATGVSERPGKFRSAEHGTLFLDEVGEMPLELQAKLLRAVEQKSIQPVGDTETPVDVRVVAATNNDLLKLTREGRFRSDLYYRLAGVVLSVPSLRERRDDIAPLMERFLRSVAETEGRRIRGLTVKALRLLEEYAWPGNVRELIHEAKRLACLAADNHVVDSSMLSEQLRISGPGRSGLPGPSRDRVQASEPPDVSRQTPVPQTPHSAGQRTASRGTSLQLRDHVRETERRVIQAALEQAGGSQRKAAEFLGISRTTLRRKIADLAIGT